MPQCQCCGRFVSLKELQAKHDARVTELLTVINREVERRRKAEDDCRMQSVCDPWIDNNLEAMSALIEGLSLIHI